MSDTQEFDNSYFLRSKKRKINDGEEITASVSNEISYKKKNAIMLMPLEILQNVFKFINYRELSNQVRRVNQKFKLAAEDLLNKAFKNISKKLKNLSEDTQKAIEKTSDDMEIKCLVRLLNLLDVVNFQYEVIMATIWRYVCNDFYRTQKSCMYGGLILDLFDDFFYKFEKLPSRIYAHAVLKEYSLPEEVKRIVHVTKKFCVHFDKISEEPMKSVLSASACKIVDLLDCAVYAQKNVVYERIDGIPSQKESTLKMEQRMMQMRIRRLILAHTEMFMQQFHYDREIAIRADEALKKPGVMVYTGYGDVNDTFFCYGAMNDAAYLQKFHFIEEHDDPDIEEALFQVEDFPTEIQDDDFLFIPHLGLDINVTIDCPLAYAPYKFLQENAATVRAAKSTNGIFDLRVEFNFPGAHYVRLPTNYTYRKTVRIGH